MAPVPVAKLIIGSGLVFTFLKARSHSAGYHQAEDDLNELVTKLKEQAKAKGVKAILPSGGTGDVEDTFAMSEEGHVLRAVSHETEKIVDMPKVEYAEKIVHVPKAAPHVVEKIAKVPQSECVEMFVEVTKGVTVKVEKIAEVAGTEEFVKILEVPQYAL